MSLITWDLLLCLYTLDRCHIVAGDVSFSSSLDGASKPPITITVVDNLKILTCSRVCVCVCVCVCMCVCVCVYVCMCGGV